MDQFFADVMGLRTRIVTNSETAAVEGAAKALARIR
jgi:sugar (pentulose or hexulose) kinase